MIMLNKEFSLSFSLSTYITFQRHNKHIQNQSILPVEYIDQDKLNEFVPPRLKHNGKFIKHNITVYTRCAWAVINLFAMFILDTGQSEIDAIPKLFLNPTFSLENPTTFNNVLPWSHLEQHGRRSSKLLQEKVLLEPEDRLSIMFLLATHIGMPCKI